MAQIEADKFKVMVGDLGPENIAAIATSGHNNQVSFGRFTAEMNK